MKCEVRECSASASIASRSGRRPLAYGHHPLLVLGRAAHDRAQSGNSRTRRHRATTPASVYSWHDDAVGQLRCLRLGLWRRYRRIANDVGNDARNCLASTGRREYGQYNENAEDPPIDTSWLASRRKYLKHGKLPSPNSTHAGLFGRIDQWRTVRVQPRVGLESFFGFAGAGKSRPGESIER